MALLRQKVSSVIEEVDLRKTSLEYREPKAKKVVAAKIKQVFIKVMKAGGILLLNIDDSDAAYNDLYDPEFGSMFGGRLVYQNMWTPESMLQKKMWSSYVGTDEAPPAPAYMVDWR